MEKKYAKAILELIARGATPAQAVKAMHGVLEEKGREGLLRKIAYATALEGAKQARRNQAVLTVAKEDDVRDAKKEAAQYLEDVEELTVETDAHLIGGWRLEKEGSVIDTSYKTALLDIYKRITT